MLREGLSAGVSSILWASRFFGVGSPHITSLMSHTWSQLEKKIGLIPRTHAPNHSFMSHNQTQNLTACPPSGDSGVSTDVSNVVIVTVQYSGEWVTATVTWSISYSHAKTVCIFTCEKLALGLFLKVWDSFEEHGFLVFLLQKFFRSAPSTPITSTGTTWKETI